MHHKASGPGSGLLAAALDHAAHGWHVFPLAPRSKRPLLARCPTAPTAGGERLAAHAAVCHAGGHGFHDATCDPDVIRGWWTATPQANVGVATGASGLVVVDLDGDDAVQRFRQLVDRHGGLPATAWVRTARGWHAYFTRPSQVEIRNSTGRLAPGVDIRGGGGAVVAPPSIHPSGVRYRWARRGDIAPLPDWLVDLALPPRTPSQPMAVEIRGDASRYARAALEREAAAVAAAELRTRHSTLNAAAFKLGTLVGAGALNADDVAEVLAHAAQACGLPPAEAERTIRSGLAAGTAHPRDLSL